MATLLDAPKANPAKQGEFVAKHVADVRRRIRAGDMYAAAVVALAGFAVYLFAVTLVDRYVPTRPGLGWASLLGFGLLACAFLYRALYRGGRRDINPYYAAKRIEGSIPDAKNSVVNWIDLHEDEKLAPSLKVALGAKAAKDLKGADLSHVGEEKSFLVGAAVAAVFLIGAGVVYFLPPTRTEIVLQSPKGGDATVFSGEDVRFEAVLVGRIPKPADGDSARLRIWYNPDDDETFEDRALDASPDDRRLWGVTVKANQVRKGFDYQVRAGGEVTPRFHLTCKIIPILTGFEVAYAPPEYLKKPEEKANDPNLFGYYGTRVTLLATTNRTAKAGYIQIEGQSRTYDAEVPADRPDALRFRFALEKEGSYRIFFTTAEGDRNTDPQKYRIALADPKPAFTRFDAKYQYPDYLRWKPQTLAGQKSPDVEAVRGTLVTLTARTNRPAKSGTMTFDRPKGAAEPRDIPGEIVAGEPLALRFKLPPLDADRAAQIRFVPATDEAESAPQPVAIRALRDEAPQVKITKPEEALVVVPLNDALRVEGLATDDHGIARMNLQMAVVEPVSEILLPKPYREGKEFKRDKDGSYPARLEYKDQVALADIRSDNKADLRIAEGMVVEYWLEAVDNCNVPPGPNHGYSKHQRFRVGPATKADQAKAQDRNRDQFAKDKKEFEEKQDRQNADEKRDDQPPPKGEDGAQNGEAKKDGSKPDGAKQPGAKKDAQPKDAQPKKGEPQDGAGQQGEPQPGNSRDDQNAKPNPDSKEDAARGENPKGGNPAKRPEARDPKNAPKSDGKAKSEPGLSGDAPMTPEERATEEKAEKIKERLAQNDPQPKGENKREPEKTPMPKSRDGDGQPGKSQGGPGQPGKADDKQPPAPPPEPGELAREIASSKDGRMNPGQKEDVERLLRDEKKKADMEKQLDRAKDQIQDPMKKERFQKDVDQAKRDAKEKDDIDKLAKKAESKDPLEAKAAQDELDKKMQDPASRKNGEQVAGEDGQKGKDPAAKAEQQAKKDAIQKAADKGREKNLEDAAKKMQSGDPQEQAKGQKEMEELQKDPATRQKAQEKKDELAKGAGGDEQKKKDFEKKMDQAGEKGRQDNVDKIAKEAESDDPRDQKQAQKDLDNLKKNDPEAGQKAEEKVEQAQTKQREQQQAKGGEAGDPKGGQEDGKNGQKSQGNKQMAKKGNGQPGGGAEGEGEGDPEQGQKDLNELDRELQSKNPKMDKGKQAAMERLLRDPKLREQLEKKKQDFDKGGASDQAKKDVQDKFDEAEKNADTRDKIDRDVEQLVKKDPPKAGAGDPKAGPKKDGLQPEGSDPQDDKGTPKDGKQDKGQAKGGSKKGDPKAGDKGEAGSAEAQKARDDLNEMAKDPAKREQMENAAKDLAKKNPEGAKELQKAADKAREEALKDAAKQAGEPGAAGQKGEKDLAEMMKDPKTRDMLEKAAKGLAEQAKDPEKRKQLEEMMKKAAEGARQQDLKDLADRAQRDPQEAAKAARDLKDLMDKDPAAKKAAEEMAKAMNDPAAKKGLEDLQKKAGELAKAGDGKRDPEKMPMPKRKDDATAKKEGEGEKENNGSEKKDDVLANKQPKDKDGKRAGGPAPKDGSKDGKNPDRVAESKGEGDKLEGMAADPKNRLKASELQLDNFKKVKDNKDLLQKLNMTPEEYERFLKSYEDSVAKQRDRLKELEKAVAAKPRGSGGSILNRGADAVKLQGNGKDDPLERGGQTIPPPGFEKAAQRANGASEGIAPK